MCLLKLLTYYPLAIIVLFIGKIALNCYQYYWHILCFFSQMIGARSCIPWLCRDSMMDFPIYNRAVQQRPINRYSVISSSIRSADSLTDYSGEVKLVDYLGGVKLFDYPGVVKYFDYNYRVKSTSSILPLKCKQSGYYYFDNQSTGSLVNDATSQRPNRQFSHTGFTRAHS